MKGSKERGGGVQDAQAEALGGGRSVVLRVVNAMACDPAGGVEEEDDMHTVHDDREGEGGKTAVLSCSSMPVAKVLTLPLTS